MESTSNRRTDQVYLADLLDEGPEKVVPLRPADNRAVALRLAAEGKPVFPCGPDKKPLTIHGFKDASTDPEQICLWWRLHPGSLVGLPTGDVSGLAVLDLDTKDGKDGVAALRAKGFDPDTLSPLIVVTPSGGRHLYFQQHPGLVISNGKDGIDVRANGGYAIAPGSVLPDGRSYSAIGRVAYDNLPKWPAELKSAQRSTNIDLEKLLGDEPLVDWEKVKRALACITDADDRDDWLRIGMALHDASGGDDQGYQIWCNWSEQSLKFNSRDQSRTWRRFKSGGGVTIASLFDLAGDYGFSHGLEINSDMFDDPDDGFLPGLMDDRPAKRKALDWHTQLDRDGKGRLKTTPHNVAVIVRHAPQIAGTFGFNEFTGKTEVVAPPRLQGDFWLRGPLKDVQEKAVKTWISSAVKRTGFGITPSSEGVHDAIVLVARDHAFHPIRDRITAVDHDGRARAETLFIDYLHCPDTPYFRETARLMLVAAVARIFEPGHKFDFMPILEGPQGIRKSTFVRTMGLDWYGDPTISDWGNPQKVQEATSGFWIVEMGELAGMYRSEANDLKAGLSKTADTARAAYGRNAETVKRQCIFVGTTNDGSYLKDPTGNRRFWPIPCAVDQIDTDRLAREMPQIWAEALTLYRAMRADQPHGDLPLYLRHTEAQEEAERLQTSRRMETAEDSLSGRIVAWLDASVTTSEGDDDLDPAAPSEPRNVTCAAEIWSVMLANGNRVMMRNDATLIGQALAQTGWQRSPARESLAEYGRTFVYRRPS